MKLELPRDYVVFRSVREGEGHVAIPTLQEAAIGGHEDSDAMNKGRTGGWCCLHG